MRRRLTRRVLVSLRRTQPDSHRIPIAMCSPFAIAIGMCASAGASATCAHQLRPLVQSARRAKAARAATPRARAARGSRRSRSSARAAVHTSAGIQCVYILVLVLVIYSYILNTHTSQMTGVSTRRRSESRQTSGCQIECSVDSSISEHKSQDMNMSINLSQIKRYLNQIKTATFVRGERANCRAQRADSDQLQANAGRGHVLSSSAKARLHELHVQWRSVRCLFLRQFLFLLPPRLLLSLCLFKCLSRSRSSSRSSCGGRCMRSSTSSSFSCSCSRWCSRWARAARSSSRNADTRWWHARSSRMTRSASAVRARDSTAALVAAESQEETALVGRVGGGGAERLPFLSSCTASGEVEAAELAHCTARQYSPRHSMYSAVSASDRT